MRARVLVVEDEQIVALELRERLTRLGHEVVGVCASGKEAIEDAARLHPDLVLMDVKLQGAMDGIEAAAAIRTDVDIPIVYLTAFADGETLQRAKLTEPYGYILKPFQERELHVVIEVSLYRHRIERALRESEARRVALLESVADAVLAADTDRRVTFMNPLAQALTGWTEADARGRPLDEVFKLVPRVERRRDAWKDLASKSLIDKHGTKRPVDVELTTIRDTRQVSMGTVCVFRDVTERKRLEDRQRFMTAASGVVSSSLDRGTLLTRVCALIAPGFTDWCVVHLEDAQGRLQFEILVHRTAARNAACQQLIGRVVRENEAIEVRSVARTRSSVLEPSIVGDAWLSDALGIPPGVAADLGAASAMIVPLVAGGTCFGTLALVSERHERRFDESDVVFAEELGRRVAQGIEHARLYAEAQRALRMRDDVLAVVTHDLKNPLSSILMNAHQLLRAPGKADVPWLVKKASAVRRNAERMNRLIDDLVDVARIDTGRLSIELRPHGARALVAEIIATFEPIAADHAIDLVSASIPNLDLLCDRGRIFQVLSNLVGNALKFSADGREVVIRGEVRGALLELAVVDQGIGIPPDQIEHVFDRHWQAPEAVHRGTGLGLFIAKGIVEAHGGRIWADSTPGVGSTFHFTIPLAARTAERASAP